MIIYFVLKIFLKVCSIILKLVMCILYTCRRKWQPTPVFLSRKSHRQRSPVGFSPWAHKESDTTQQLNYHHHILYTKIHLRLFTHTDFFPQIRVSWMATIFQILHNLEKLSPCSSVNKEYFVNERT